MTEKEKMLAGMPYDTRDPELLSMYHAARRRMKVYNNLASDALEERRNILRELLRKVGEGVWIESPFFCDYGKFIEIGKNTFVNVNCMFLDDNVIKIGENSLIGPYVQIYTAGHPLKADERILKDEGFRYQTFTKPVTIGDNVWIGGNSVIFPGVTIGDNVTVGGGSVVTKDIPDNTLAYGNPCRVRREL